MGRAGWEEAVEHGAAPPARVRVTGLRRDAYVEFVFSLGDDTLTVELILPFAGFAEFCAQRRATIETPAPDIGAQIERLAWRLRRPELFRQLGYIALPAQAAPASSGVTTQS
ncbi:phenol hydroxylase subunit [Rhodopila globiformis]|uniref:phenol hydroxylase subunit n=1 Tax=Rhodopila globiformis TaxID=1071 RepID=UPI0011AFE2FD|nr:phenol hydroxylase subunit [Rhodopila globiformis]